MHSILETTQQLYEGQLWDSAAGESARAWLAREGIDEEVVRAFGLGYAPGDRTFLVRELGARGHGEEELEQAGVATRSARGHLHVALRSRIVFPVADPEGAVVGFAGLATNPGPSWPEWVTSAETSLFRRREALFGIDHAGSAIREAGVALVLRDCREVLLRHARGERNCVALVRSELGDAHSDLIAAALGADGVAIAGRRNGAIELIPGGRRTGGSAPPGAPVPSPSTRGAPDRGPGVRPEPTRERTTAERIGLALARTGIGVGLPVAWALAVGPDGDEAGGPRTAFIGAVGGVAASYVVLTIAASLISARIRARSRSRRMRTPWERGLSEWQPPAWTYHLLEEVLVGAAMISIAVCFVLFFAIGGFVA